MFKAYYQLTKPGIIYGNAITTVAGFFLASKGHFNLGLFLAALIGISLVIASGCVFNNYIDKDLDATMERTKNRALVTGAISVRGAIVFGAILGLLGLATLGLLTNTLTAEIALLGLFFYVVLYSLAKRRSVYGTIVGSISGAVPPVVGYCAVTGRFDLGALILFLILVFWQMPHFYAIAIFRQQDYTAAGLPVLPVVKGLRTTKIHILFYILAFTIAAAALYIFKFAGIAVLSHGHRSWPDLVLVCN